MNKMSFLIPVIAIISLLVGGSCKKKTSIDEKTDPKSTVGSITTNDTILNVNYENGIANSGITGVQVTAATAVDAAYIVSPGSKSTYAIAHKVVHGDTAYYSAENWRSESSADGLAGERFLPGDERRYEFSVLLKDWILDPQDPTESNFFQLKETGATGVPLQIRTTRNAIVLRFPLGSGQPNVTILSNAQNYVNQWIQFRVDVLWSKTATGYMRTYMKLPGESDYTLKDDKTNTSTYCGLGQGGQHGYIKWGLYIVPTNTTRIVYHDDIRIIALN